jgi:antitoxin (DNA-binding transcriptional repressor) of toxin-antitoxin stability system
MKIVTREMKVYLSQGEKLEAHGEIIEVLNREKLRVRLVPARGRQRVIWDDHLATAIPNKGTSTTETVDHDRRGRW